ncbi:MAG: rhodanese-like domain-containing protein [Prevotella sp.]|nr:rhodanese-like domain-containing protein [Prevotella sp.]MBR5689406.1 rhodanese-like domain-containing protein [Prevotella sp.]MBR6016363.1 rhodanese-like domain-containing protein [Prevotella sp.]MBR6455960.1 rhodanese-like domain-containing protein [Prevotella sp.]
MNKLMIGLLLVIAVVAVWALGGQGSSAYKTVNVEEFEQLVKRDSVQLLDVRTQAEYDEGHLENALLIDVNGGSFLADAQAQLQKDKTVAVYCRSGRRSASAAEKLGKDGFDVVNLDGGITAWIEAGKDTVK